MITDNQNVDPVTAAAIEAGAIARLTDAVDGVVALRTTDLVGAYDAGQASAADLIDAIDKISQLVDLLNAQLAARCAAQGRPAR